MLMFIFVLVSKSLFFSERKVIRMGSLHPHLH
jgi:hypothetical protein